MTEAEALRVLGLSPGADDAAIRSAFRAQVRRFREARQDAEPALAARLDSALRLTMLARETLLKSDTFRFAVTQEMPALQRMPRARLAALAGAGVFLLAAGLLTDPAAPPDGAPTLALDTAPPPPIIDSETPGDDAMAQAPGEGATAEASGDGAAAPQATRTAPVPPPDAEGAGRVATPLSRAALDPVRLALARRWRAEGDLVLPARTTIPSAVEADLAPDRRIVPQREGAFALVDGTGDWRLAVPRVDGDTLRWNCFAPEAGDCPVLDAPGLAEALAQGEIDAVALATAFERRGDGELAELWLRAAVARGDGRGAERLAERRLAGGDPPSVDARRQALEWLARADALHERAGRVRPRLAVLARRVRLSALDPEVPRSRVAGLLVDCRRLQRTADRSNRCPEPGEIGAELEATADSPAQWRQARWWYEQAVAERSPAGARGLARLLALGRTGPVDRDGALVLLEDAAERWDAFAPEDAGAVAFQISEIWEHGWGTGADPAQASWWASQGARTGHVGSALKLASAFALGIGTPLNMQRARDLVAIYAEISPVFEVAFYLEVGRRLAEGDGVPAEPGPASAWRRRAFERCRTLATGGDTAAQLELAHLFLQGHGTAADPTRAISIYEILQETLPVPAGNMLAWIRATHPDVAHRDGAKAIRLARAVVATAPSADHFDTLAAAHAERGDFAEARRLQRHALDLLREEGDPVLGGLDIAERRSRMETRLSAYREERPWRDPQAG